MENITTCTNYEQMKYLYDIIKALEAGGVSILYNDEYVKFEGTVHKPMICLYRDKIEGIDEITGEEILKIVDKKVFTTAEKFGKFISNRIEVLSAPLSPTIDELGLSSRSRNALLRDGYFCLGDFVGVHRCELVKIRNFGRRSLTELEGVLAKYGIFLK